MRSRRLVLLDIAPTLAMYEQTTEAFARAYWHWFFLIQPAAAARAPDRGRPGGLHVRRDGQAQRRAFAVRPARARRVPALHGAARRRARDLRGLPRRRRASTSSTTAPTATPAACWQLPLLVLWGKQGIVQRCFKPLDEWRRVARDVRGEALPCGHYIAEEAPDALLAEVMPFFA